MSPSRSVSLVIAGLLAGCEGLLTQPVHHDSYSARDDGDGRGGGIDDPGEVPHTYDPASPRFLFTLEAATSGLGVRFLSRAALERSLEAVSGGVVDGASLPVGRDLLGLSNDAVMNGVQDAAQMRELFDISMRLAGGAPALALCTECTGEPLRVYLERLFLQHVDDVALQAYEDVYETAVLEGGADLGRRAVLQRALLSPFHLHDSEVGDASGRLTALELAAKLAMLLWGERPDAALLTAAVDGSLLQPATYAAQVERLLASEKVAVRLSELVSDWLDIDHLDLSSKADFVSLPATLASSMREEVRQLVRKTLFVDRTGLRGLLTASQTFVDADLAVIYGVAAPGATDSQFVLANLSGTGRRGVLTTPAVLAAHSKESGRSPMVRGNFLLRTLVCHAFPPEAGAAAMELPSTGDSLRASFAVLETQAPCSNCHRTLNAGFAFDRFDPVGRRFPTSLVAETELAGVFDLPPYGSLTFEGAEEAVDALADLRAVYDCFTYQAYRFAQGRLPGAQDAALLAELSADFFVANGDAIALLRAIANSELFRTAAWAQE